MFLNTNAVRLKKDSAKKLQEIVWSYQVMYDSTLTDTIFTLQQTR